jgi:PPM family protein phosphatase
MLRVADYFADSDTGRARRANEDAFFAHAPVFAVADGMGGAQAGEVASRTVVDCLRRGLPDGGSPEERLAALAEEANGLIHRKAAEDEQRAGMGTTLTAAYVDESAVSFGHVGDSRAYLFRDGTLRQLTNDHSLVGEMVRRGKLTAEQAEEHPQRSIITRALGPEPAVEVDHMTTYARDGDVFLLCSDGLTSMVGDDAIEQFLREAPDLRSAGQALIDAANAAGGRDNITVILFRLEEVGAVGGGPSTQDTTEHEAVTARPGAEPATAAGAAAAGPATAVAEAAAPARESAQQAAARRREPRPPRGDEPERRRRRRFRLPTGVLVVLCLVGAIALGAWYASQTVYFVGASDDGFVTVYRGLPYDGPAGLNLYGVNYTSGVPVSELPANQKRLVTEHKLRSRDDARDLVRQMETGALSGS